MGDSHVRRLEPYKSFLIGRLPDGLTVEFLHRGGSGVAFVEENIDRARGCDEVIVMTGGNDIYKYSANEMICAYNRIERALLAIGVSYVIFTSIWSRSDGEFNRRTTYLGNAIVNRYWSSPRSAGWVWERRQPVKNYDGVHFERKGYQRAIRYLPSPIQWALRRLGSVGVSLPNNFLA